MKQMVSRNVLASATKLGERLHEARDIHAANKHTRVEKIAWRLLSPFEDNGVILR